MTQLSSTTTLPPATGFASLGLAAPLLRALAAEGYLEPTPIQAQAIPVLLEGRDLLGCAQTGTGKTAAFALPILQRLSQPRPEASRAKRRPIRALVLAPTRELASQINDSFAAYGRHAGLVTSVVFGGVGQGPQVRQLQRGSDILVATPGRLLDLIGQGHVHLEQVEVFVLDEADRMLDMGFVRDVRKVVALLPARRQTLLFSATMPRDIEALAASILNAPARIAVAPVATTAEKIAQSVYFVGRGDKGALFRHLLRNPELSRVLAFTRTKHGANKLALQLEKDGTPAEAIHGNKSQSAREKALASFKSGSVRVLVATDIAARGIDVDGVTHVVNFDLPNVPESYVHRIGRTARAGAEGIAISFCDAEERPFLADIERTIRLAVPVVADHPFSRAAASSRPPMPPQRPTGPAANGNGHGNSNGYGNSQGRGREGVRNGEGRAPAKRRHTRRSGRSLSA